MGCELLVWSKQDDQLRQLWQAGESPDRIAACLSRSLAAVMTRASRLGLPRRFAPGRKASAGGSLSRRASMLTVVAMPRPPVEASSASKASLVTRACLRCASKFVSAGAHNRICPRCKDSPDYHAASRLPDLGFPS